MRTSVFSVLNCGKLVDIQTLMVPVFRQTVGQTDRLLDTFLQDIKWGDRTEVFLEDSKQSVHK